MSGNNNNNDNIPMPDAHQSGGTAQNQTDAASRPVTINLPPLNDPVSNCNAHCVELANNYERECDIMRRRIEQALEDQGCPSTICKKTSSYATTSTTSHQGCQPPPTYGGGCQPPPYGGGCQSTHSNTTCQHSCQRRCGCYYR